LFSNTASGDNRIITHHRKEGKTNMPSALLKKSRVVFVFPWLLLAMSSAATKTARIYVANYGDSTISVVDAASNKVVRVIEGIAMPHGVVTSPDGKRIYASSESEQVLDVVDPESGKIVKKIALSGRPQNLAITHDGARVLVCIRSDPAALDVVDTTSLEKVKSIPMKDGLHNVVVTPDGKYAVASSPPGHSLVVVDLKTEQTVWDMKFDKETRALAMESGPDGSTRRIFVQYGYYRGLGVIDFATHKEVARFDLPDEPKAPESQPARPNDLPPQPKAPESAAPPTGDRRVSAGGPVSPSHGLGVNPDGKTLWVDSAYNRCVFVYALPNLKLLGYVFTGGQPAWLSFSPDGGMVYVSNAEEGTLSVIDSNTREEVAHIPVGRKPMRTAFSVAP
jgi:YVTN family beta-propeller protein